MTLHEAIELVLRERGAAMNAGEIADAINKRELYLRKDKLPVSASQINARVTNHQKLFVKEFEEIKLVLDGYIQQYENYRQIDNPKFSTVEKPYYVNKVLVQEALKKVLKTLINDDDKDFIDNTVKEPSLHYGNDVTINREKLIKAYQLFQWSHQKGVRNFMNHGSNEELIVSDSLATFLAAMKWFNSGNHEIMSTLNYSSHYLLKIAFENPEARFTKVDFRYGYGDQKVSFYEDTNQYVEELLLKCTVQSKNDIIPSKSTGIMIPPMGVKQDERFGKLITQIVDNPELDKVIMLVPTSVLFGMGKKEMQLREKIVNSGYLESVVQFSGQMLQNTDINTALLILNFTKRRDTVFFLDATFEGDLKPAEILNENHEITNTSIKVKTNKIEANGFDLSPGRYIYYPEIDQVEPGYTLYRIEDLILDKKQGVPIKNRSSLYIGGEYKVIRTREIDGDYSYFPADKSIPGIDHDEALNISKHLVNGGIVLSGFNRKLKHNILPEDNSYLLGQDVFWIKPNKEIVLEEYFIRELNENYVLDQVKKYSKGAVIVRLSLKDFLQIQVKVPSLEMQKDLLLADIRNFPMRARGQSISESEIDYIKTLEHSLKQPSSGLGNDLSSLRNFLHNKSKTGEPLNINESVVPLFESDTPAQIAIHSLSNTLERMVRAVTDIEYILKQARLLTTIDLNPNLEFIELNPFFKNFETEYPEIAFHISGRAEITGDRKQLRILFNNLIQNARQHGFMDMEEPPEIWIAIEKKDELSIQISFGNNGKSLPPEFTIEDFLAKGKSSRQDVGSGFGGFLIGQILKNHKGEIALFEPIVNNAFVYKLPYPNVEFLITLPK